VIRATSTYDSTKYGICTVSVAPSAPSGVTLDTAAVTLSVDGSQSLPETWQLTATVSPSDATDKSVTWSSDAPDVANVDDTGLVTAHSAGTATITVTTADGSQTDTCTVRVGSLAASNAEAAKITGFAVGNNDSSHLCFNAGGYDTLTSGAGIALVEVRAGAASPGSVVDFDAELTGKTLAFHTGMSLTKRI
ncbi:MAG: Ig-like domain-containing protein, partial [Hungatella hathewayi]